MMKRFRKHRIIRALVAGVGIILFWRGVWGLADMTPILSNEFVSIGFGIILLVISGLLMKEMI